MMKLDIFKDTDARIPRSRIQRLFNRVVKAEGHARKRGNVNLIITDNKGIRNLNRQFRSLDKATDVLSFNLDGGKEPGSTLGEIYLSAEYARAQAESHDRSIWDEYTLLVCHGLLHLFGYDHADLRQEKAMFALQEKYLKGRR